MYVIIGAMTYVDAQNTRSKTNTQKTLVSGIVQVNASLS
jgi:hypothetical protein